MLRGCWCNVIVLNVLAPKEKSGDPKDSLHEELEWVFNHFPKYHMKIQLVDLNAKLERENVLKLAIRMRVFFRIVMIMELVNVATSENLVVNSTIFPHRNIYKYTWTSPNGNTHKHIDHIF